jgi:predicted aconitase
MDLTREEEAMASGRHGPGVEKCMDILIKFGEAFGANRLVKLASAHTMPKEPIDLLDKMTEGVSRVGTFTTTHALMSAFSPVSWQAMGIPEDFASREIPIYEKRSLVYRRAGFYQTYTCLPMMVGNLPRKGQHVSWIGSGAQLLANSVLGAKTNRDGTVMTLAGAITGRAPEWGLFLDENRHAEMLVTLKGLNPDDFNHTDYGAIGYYLGSIAGDRSIVIEGLPRGMDIDQIKYLMAPLAVTGAVKICHVVGVTPDAPNLEQALGHKKPSETVNVGKEDIMNMKALYADAEGLQVDMALFGCPHMSVEEIKTLASLLDGKTLKDDKRLWLGAPYQLYYLAKNMGYTDVIEKAGGTFASACMATVPDSPIPEGVKVIATNSFKAAHYISRIQKGQVKVLIGEMQACIEAVTGGHWKGETS